MLCSLLFLCCLDFGVWSLDHKVKIFSFLFTFFVTFFHFFFGSFLLVFLNLLSCCLAPLPRFVASRPQIAALSPYRALCYLIRLPHSIISLPHYLVALCYLIRLFHSIISLPHYLVVFCYLVAITPQVPFDPPSFVVLRPCCLALHCLIALLLHCFVLVGTSILFYKEDLGTRRRNSLATTREG